MATSQAPKRRVHQLRLLMLIIDGGTEVLRNLFEQGLLTTGCSLSQYLSQEKGTVTRLRSQKTITQKQYDLLYPAQGNISSTEDFDLTLLVCLLRNLRTCGLNRRYTWNATPQANDTTIEADICRLREFRNELAHISSTTGVSLADFRFKWTELEKVLLRLNSTISNPGQNLQQIIDELKSCSLDPEREEQLLKEVEEWEKMEKGLESQLQDVKRNVHLVRKDVQEVKKDNQLVKKDVQLVQEDVQKQEQRTFEHAELITDTQNRIAGLEEEATRQKTKNTNHLEDNESKYVGYSKLKKKLKDELITHNRNRHSNIPLSPLFEENDTPVVDFFITPEMNSIPVNKFFLSENERKTKIGSLEDIFSEKDKSCTEIYMTAEAGFGKTAFCKWLAVTWCQSKKPEPNKCHYFKDKDLNAMNRFEFLFLIHLRDSCKDCTIDEMIQNQILKHLARPSTFTLQLLEEVLSTENCLILLDGLDEWSHPDSSCPKMPKLVPHRNARDRCVILTTTRQWKLSVLGLKRSEVHQKLEIIGLSDESVKELKYKAISKIKGKRGDEVMDEVSQLDIQITDRKITDFEKVPLLLMYLVCLWCDGVPLGSSKCEFYGSIIELLLQRTINKYQGTNTLPEPNQMEIPNCLREQPSCTTYYQLLQELGQLSFEALCSQTRENTLAFDSSIAGRCLTEDDLKFCLLSGLLRRSKTEAKLTSQKYKVSFAHKTVQEYFAALYMSSTSDQTNMLNTVQAKCNSVKNILELSKVFVFLNGFSLTSPTSDKLSEMLFSVVADDAMTRKYRTMSRLYNYKHTVQPMKDIQDVYVDCKREALQNDVQSVGLCLQDVFIDRSCHEKEYASCLQRLVLCNKQNVKSLSIETEGISSLDEIITSFTLHDICGVNKIWYKGECEEKDIVRLLTSSVKTLKAVSLTSCEWRDSTFMTKLSSWSLGQLRTVQLMQNLEAINIDSFVMEHGLLEEFTNYLAGRKSMKEIRLNNVRCTDDSQCEGHGLDVSQHDDLGIFALCNIPLSKLNISVSSLRYCKVGPLCKPAFASSYLSYLPAASKLQTFWCSYLESPDDIEVLLQTLPRLAHVKNIRLRGMDLGDKILELSPEMVNVGYIRLLAVRMTGSSLNSLVKAVESFSQSVTVDLRGCTIKPEEEFLNMKKHIESSKTFDILFDRINQFSDYAFEFKTIKHECKT